MSSPTSRPRSRISPATAPGSFWYLLLQLRQTLRPVLEEAFRTCGLTAPQALVLATLEQAPGLSNAQLARAICITPQSMAEVLAGLESADLVVRRPHPAGGRILQAELTETGRETLKACEAAVADVESRLLARVTVDERRQLRELLERCIRSLREAPIPIAASGHGVSAPGEGG